MSLRLEIAGNLDELNELQVVWDRAADSMQSRSPYDSWLLQVGTWRVREDGNLPSVLVLMDRTDPLALLPMATIKGPRLHSGRTLRPLAQRSWPDFRLVAPAIIPAEGRRILIDAIAKQSRLVDMIDLRFLRDPSEPGASLITEATGLTMEAAQVPNGRIRLDPGQVSWQGMVSKQLRKSVSYQWRRMTTDHAEACYQRISHPSELGSLLDQFQRLSLGRAREKGWDSLVATGGYDRGFPALFDQWLLSGVGEFHVIRIGDQLIAGQIILRGGRTAHLYRVAFNPAFGLYSPGSILQSFSLQHSIELGDEYFDFGLGGDSYKTRWVNEWRELYHLRGPGRRWSPLRTLARRLKSYRDPSPDTVSPEK